MYCWKTPEERKIDFGGFLRFTGAKGGGRDTIPLESEKGGVRGNSPLLQLLLDKTECFHFG